MNDHLAPDWRPLLKARGLDDFDALWHLEADWFEPPNQRRGGWSGVVYLSLDDGSGGRRGLFLKRQENHTRKTWRHPIAREPTFRAEARNLRLLEKHGIPAPRLVFYAERRTPAGWRVILATAELEGFMPLDRWLAAPTGGARARHRLTVAIARLLRRFHALGQAHNALHAKHIFVDPAGGRAALIDLEKMRPRLTRRQAMLRDLDSLNRHSFHTSAGDRLRFLLAYLDKPRADRRVRALWRRLAAMAERKQRRKKRAS